MGAAEALQPTLHAIAARCLRVPPEALDPLAPLTRYGLDSLSAVELGVAISEATGMSLADDMLFDAPSIAELAQLLRAGAQETHARQSRLRLLHEDTRLPADIDPQRAQAACGGALLLTGATGFVGVHLLAALLQGDARDVVCLVRAASDARALERIRAAMRRFGVRAPGFDKRVRAIAADICRPSLGLTARAYDALAARIGTVVHCAAEVNWTRPYEALRAANVGATEAVLRLACTGTRKDVHYLSSVAACYSTRSVAPVSERGPAPDPEGIHLGYGQSKWVAERLVEASARRGLRATIYRPTLIAGDSTSGIGNDEDFLARMLHGCIALGHAPALDWRLDACPVDFVARAIAATALAPAEPRAVLHLRNPRAVRWTEAVLWMNLRGYPVVLDPFERWIERVERCSRETSHPLHRLRGFLLHRPPGEGGKYLPQLYAEPHVAGLDAAASDAVLGALGVDCPRLGAAVFERYFDAWVARGVLPAAAAGARPPRRAARARSDRAIEAALRRHCAGSGFTYLGSVRRDFGGEHSILGELASWRAGADLALHARTIELQHPDGRRSSRDVVVKPKLADALVLDVTADVASQCDPALGDAFRDYGQCSEFATAGARETALYASAGGALRARSPACYGVIERGDQRVLLLERVHDAELIDSVNRPAAWTLPRIEATLAGIAAIHAQWLGCEAEAFALSAFDCALPADSADAAQSWWLALAAHARPWLLRWLGEDGAGLHAALAARALCTSAGLRAHPRTLIHHDFNPRNLALRTTPNGPELCAFDWELAAYGLPQRDLAELLAFVVSPAVELDVVQRLAEHHRRALQAAAGVGFDRAQWLEGLRLALMEFGVKRLPMYFIAHRFRPQAFLERVTRAWFRLARLLGVV